MRRQIGSLGVATPLKLVGGGVARPPYFHPGGAGGLINPEGQEDRASEVTIGY